MLLMLTEVGILKNLEFFNLCLRVKIIGSHKCFASKEGANLKVEID